jgi:hypothetical protein
MPRRDELFQHHDELCRDAEDLAVHIRESAYATSPKRMRDCLTKLQMLIRHCVSLKGEFDIHAICSALPED